MSDQPFQSTQRAFAAHLRQPQRNPAPAGIEDRRMKIYRDLFYNNVENFLSSGFPVIRSLTDDTAWHALVRRFFAEHACHSPYFVDIPKAFVEYLSATPEVLSALPPWLLEMAHYEWMEVALDISHEEIPRTGFNPDGDLLAAAPMLSPLICVLSYHWPVHHIGIDFQPQAPLEQPVWLVIYRGDDDQVRFMEINAATAALLQALEASPLASGAQVLTSLAQQFAMPEAQMLSFGAQALSHLRSRGILLGTRLQDIEELDT